MNPSVTGLLAGPGLETPPLGRKGTGQLIGRMRSHELLLESLSRGRSDG